ncbi:MAG: hypothetical protein WD883_01395 [Candidatus Colwellbacteria bacterium]
MKLLQEYIDFLRPFIKTQRKIRVAIDCSDGATGPIIEALFKDHPHIEPILYNSTPNGEFPAHGPDPLAVEAVDDIRREVKTSKADIGIIFDGDGDRVRFADEKGEVIDPYIVLTCLKDQFKPPYVVDIRALAELTMPEVDVIEERVGRYFIIKTMREHKAELGGEYSGHYYFKDFFYADSGIMAAIFMINYTSSLIAKGQTLSANTDNKQQYIRMPEYNFDAEDQKKEMDAIKDYFAGQGYRVVERDGITVMGDDVAFNVRASFTEPTLRLNLAARNEDILQEKLAQIKRVLGLK